MLQLFVKFICSNLKALNNSDNNETLVWKLNKSLYSLKQSGRNWNSLLHTLFGENGLTQSKVDACLYYQMNNEKTIFVVVWVDERP